MHRKRSSSSFDATWHRCLPSNLLFLVLAIAWTLIRRPYGPGTEMNRATGLACSMSGAAGFAGSSAFHQEQPSPPVPLLWSFNMDAVFLQDRVNRGRGKAATAVGAMADAFRPSGSYNPLATQNRFLRLPVAFSLEAGGPRAN